MPYMLPGNEYYISRMFGEIPGFREKGGGGDGGASGFGSSGDGINSNNLNGYYYDWYSGTYKTTDGSIVSFGVVMDNAVTPHGYTFSTTSEYHYSAIGSMDASGLFYNWKVTNEWYSYSTKLISSPTAKTGGGYSGDNLFFATYMHYQFGGGRPFNVNAAALDMSGISMRTPEIQNIVKQGHGYIDLFKYMKNQTALAIGSVRLNYLGANTFSLSPDKYDFDIRWNDGSTFRNWATLADGLLHGPVIDNVPIFPSPSFFFGGTFTINFQGTITLKPQ